MAKKSELSLPERIVRMEKYVLNGLYPRLKAAPDDPKVNAEVDEYLGHVNGCCGGRLGELYRQRDFEQLDLAGKIDYVEREAIAINARLIRLYRRQASQEQIAATLAEIDAVLERLNPLYLERWVLTHKPVTHLDAPPPPIENIKFLGPDRPHRERERKPKTRKTRGLRVKQTKPNKKSKDANANKKNRKHRVAA